MPAASKRAPAAPHRVQHHGELARHRHRGAPEADALAQAPPPSAQRAVGPRTRQDVGRGLVKIRSQELVALPGDAPLHVDRARLMAPGGQPDPCCGPSRPDWNAFGSPIAPEKLSAVRCPTPGAVISSRHGGSARTMALTARSWRATWARGGAPGVEEGRHHRHEVGASGQVRGGPPLEGERASARTPVARIAGRLRGAAQRSIASRGGRGRDPQAGRRIRARRGRSRASSPPRRPAGAPRPRSRGTRRIRRTAGRAPPRYSGSGARSPAGRSPR